MRHRHAGVRASSASSYSFPAAVVTSLPTGTHRVGGFPRVSVTQKPRILNHAFKGMTQQLIQLLGRLLVLRLPQRID
jgi:hypothetical protein